MAAIDNDNDYVTIICDSYRHYKTGRIIRSKNGKPFAFRVRKDKVRPKRSPVPKQPRRAPVRPPRSPARRGPGHQRAKSA